MTVQINILNLDCIDYERSRSTLLHLDCIDYDGPGQTLVHLELLKLL